MLRRNDRGVVLPTRLLALSISAVAAGALVYVINDPDQPATNQATPTVTRSSPSPTPSESAPATTPKTVRKAPAIKRGKTLVEIFNNTRIKGFAGRTAAKAQAAGWNVVGTDNWYGTVDGTTVYYPPKYEAAARALGRDLGIRKIKAAEEPLRFDRITVILTDDYQG